MDKRSDTPDCWKTDLTKVCEKMGIDVEISKSPQNETPGNDFITVVREGRKTTVGIDPEVFPSSCGLDRIEVEVLSRPDGSRYFIDEDGKEQEALESPTRFPWPDEVECYLQQIEEDGKTG